MFVSVAMQTKFPFITNNPKLVGKLKKKEKNSIKLLLHEQLLISHILEEEFELLLF